MPINFYRFISWVSIVLCLAAFLLYFFFSAVVVAGNVQHEENNEGQLPEIFHELWSPLIFGGKAIPGAMGEAVNDTWDISKQFLEGGEKIWQKYIAQRIKSFRKSLWGFLEAKFQKRLQIVKRELEKEKQETKQQIRELREKIWK